MAFDIKNAKTAFSGAWKFDDLRKGSKLAVLFQNALFQDAVGFNDRIRFPIMTKPIKQNDWNASTGFKETEAEELVVTIVMDQNFTVYERIDKVNVPADPKDWAVNKTKMIQRGEAADVDAFVLNQFGTKTTNKMAFETIDKDNLVDAFKRLAQQAETNDFELSDAIILIDHSVATAILKSKLESVDLNLENTNVKVKKVLGEYNVVEFNLAQFGYQMIAVMPTAFAWLLGVHTPLSTGEYGEGPYYGQYFVVENLFYGGGIAQDKFVIGVTAPEQIAKKQSEATVSNVSLNSLKTQIFEKLENQFAALVKDNEKFKKEVRKMLSKASSYQEVQNVETKAEELAESMEKADEFPISAPADQTPEIAEESFAISKEEESKEI